MNDRGPRVSVVMPMFNAEATVVRALEGALAQTYEHLEIVVCDDGSRDRSRDLARDTLSVWDEDCWQVRDSGGIGPGGARNQGILASRGEYIAFLDDDDLWAPEKLEACVRELDGGPFDLVCHAEVWEGEDGNRRVRRYRDLFDESKGLFVSLMRNNPFSTSAVVVRKKHLEEAGLFDESLPSAEDYDLWLRLALLPGFRVGFIDEPLGTYALRTGSESSAIDRRFAALMEIGRRYRPQLSLVAKRGELEYWIFRARTLFTTGIRYAQQGRRRLGIWMALKGFLMWPFRADWALLALKERLRRR